MATPQVHNTGKHGGPHKRTHKLTSRLGGKDTPLVLRDADRLAYDPNGSVPASSPNPVHGVEYTSGDSRSANRWGPGHMPVGRYADALDPDPCNRKATRDRNRGLLRAAERAEARIKDSPVRATVVRDSTARRLEVNYRT